MITKKGTVKTDTMLNKQMFKEMFRPFMIISIVCLVIGIAGIAASLIWTIVAVIKELGDPPILLIIAFAAPFALGLIFVITFNVSAKKLANGGAGEIREEYEFFSDGVTITDYLKEENVGSAKLDYGAIVKRKETKHYILFYENGNVAFCVTKAKLSQEEADTVRSVVGLKPLGASVLTLPKEEVPREEVNRAENSAPVSMQAENPEPVAPDEQKQ